MQSLKKHILIESEWPDFGKSKIPPRPDTDEIEKRIESVRSIMENENLSHLVVYGDREHFANLTFLTGFDPRYEESILILNKNKTPLIVVGNECEGYLNVSPLYRAGKMRNERYQPFSLLDQPRDSSRSLKEIFFSEGIDKSSKIGCVGWKYFSKMGHPDSEHTIEIPCYIVDTLREIAGYNQVVNANRIFMNPKDGLRTFCSPVDIAYFEYTGILASEGIKRMLFGIQEGMMDYELAKLAQYNGEPLACHMTMLTSDNLDRSLASPTGALLERGKPFSVNISYWGSNCCRAGWIAESSKDMPAKAADYVEKYAGIYFEVMSEWYRLLRIGIPAGKLYTLIQENLPFDTYAIYLNPGHLIHLEEWLSSPIFEGSNIPIHSGMAIQSDVIPHSDIYFSTRIEDGFIVADEELRMELKRQYPDTYSRCQKRGYFMRNILGIELSEELLPLSNIPGIVPPFLLRPNLIFALEQ